jgi:NSS family neurotransmitter:Na+ symporter
MQEPDSQKPDRRAGGEHAWTSNLAFLLAAIGAAVGLGNIWKFPYMVGAHGGAAFVAVYLICVTAIGVPLLVAELMIGRRGGKSPIGSMLVLARAEGRSPAWRYLGWLAFMAALVGLTFYSVVAGWSLAYIVKAARGAFDGMDAQTTAATFGDLLADPLSMSLWHGLFMAATVLVVARGLHGGLERAVEILMPALFVALLVLVGYAMVVGDFSAALAFLFQPDFSQVTPKVVLMAMGQAFFSMGLGVGAIMTYGSYLPKSVSLPRVAGIIALADTGVALLAGLAIFPLVFAFGLAPGEGPGLIFVTLPIAFGQMPGGALVGTLFFFLLAAAALTSSIALLETVVSWLDEHAWFKRWMAVWPGLLAWAGGLVTVFSFNIWHAFRPLAAFEAFRDKTIFDLLDYLVSNIMLPLGGLGVGIFAGWVMLRASCRDEVGDGPVFKIWRFLVRYVAPLALGLVFAFNLG